MSIAKIFIFISLSLLCVGCRTDTIAPSTSSKYSIYEPILADRSELDSIRITEPKTILNTGKIYSYGAYLLINEIDKGYHIIDNSDAANPKNIGFLSISATREVAVRNNVLYCDNATDLITVNISDYLHPKIVGRVINIFPDSEPPDGLPVDPQYSPTNRPKNTVIIEWRLRK